ncbi:MAG: hypothetical protein RMN51_09245 [Verrucomicrobiota bacterium]|nr:hypothetical protein [Limisphaera sp.]MDW8382276.1 hypothetical protein [Verrucomicrobiota bacterium]
MLKSHELIGFMSPGLAADILNFAFEEDKATYKATLAAVAEARRLRPVYLLRQPRAQRDVTILNTLTRPSLDSAAAALLRAWLLKKHKAMLVDFLNSLGIPHEDGVVETLPDKVEDDKLQAAVEMLLGKYPSEVVAVYLHAFNEMNEVNWENLTRMLNADPRLQVGG